MTSKLPGFHGDFVNENCRQQSPANAHRAVDQAVGRRRRDLFGRHMEFESRQRHAKQRSKKRGQMRGHAPYGKQIKEQADRESGTERGEPDIAERIVDLLPGHERRYVQGGKVRMLSQAMNRALLIVLGLSLLLFGCGKKKVKVSAVPPGRSSSAGVSFAAIRRPCPGGNRGAGPGELVRRSLPWPPGGGRRDLRHGDAGGRPPHTALSNVGASAQSVQRQDVWMCASSIAGRSSAAGSSICRMPPRSRSN